MPVGPLESATVMGPVKAVAVFEKASIARTTHPGAMMLPAFPPPVLSENCSATAAPGSGVAVKVAFVTVGAPTTLTVKVAGDATVGIVGRIDARPAASVVTVLSRKGLQQPWMPCTRSEAPLTGAPPMPM